MKRVGIVEIVAGVAAISVFEGLAAHLRNRYNLPSSPTGSKGIAGLHIEAQLMPKGFLTRTLWKLHLLKLTVVLTGYEMTSGTTWQARPVFSYNIAAPLKQVDFTAPPAGDKKAN